LLALTDGRTIRILTVIDQFTRECVWLEADRSMNGPKVVAALTEAAAERGATPNSITLDNGSEFAGRAMEAWAIQTGVHLRFIRPGRAVENGFIESFNGRLRDECLNVEWFPTLEHARERLAAWRHHYNHERPHSGLDDRAPAVFAGLQGAGAKALRPL
jgi:putative transposase